MMMAAVDNNNFRVWNVMGMVTAGGIMAYRQKKPGARRGARTERGVRDKDPKWKREAAEVLAITLRKKRDQDKARQ